jgi:hypothetical protein
METIYEPHPVSLERKAELRAQGFKIVDALFKPAGLDESADDTPIEPAAVDDTASDAPKRRGRKPKVAE